MIERFEDSPGLFGCGAGTSTCAQQHCDVCGTTYNEGCDEEYDGGEWIRWAWFGPFEVCECCFGEIEKAVLGRMANILPWYRRYIDAKKEKIDKLLEELSLTEKHDEDK